MIVIVEDNASMRKAIGRIVRSMGFCARAYESAEAFLADEDRHSLVCLILDIHLGGMSGLDLVRRYAPAKGGVPVIFVNAFDSVSASMEAEALGCVAILSKPFEAELLVRAIDQAVRTRARE